ncbi:MAG: TonB-dependent receptor [Candidatus Acidiferrum sp.]
MATVVLLLAGSARAQFSGNIQGTVVDQNGGAIAQAKITLVNVATKVTAETTTDASGNYRFVSLAPGSYTVSAEAAGFGRTETPATLETGQDLNIPIALKVGTATDTVTITDEAPLVNSAETRNQMTLETQELSTLPLNGRNMISLVTLAPGVTGRGVTGGAPGSGLDNYSTETTVEASANGQGGVSNMWVIDGLDATSSVRQGVLNLTPNPDVIQEATSQVNTFSSEYGHSSSIQFAMTTKSGADQFHGLASDYFTYQKFFAKGSLPFASQKYNPFHSNNMSATIGGPIIPHHQFYFFFGIEPLRSASSTGDQSVSIPDPAFVAFAKANDPNTFGTKILTTYQPQHFNFGRVQDTAQSTFGTGPNGCNTAATQFIPCSTPLNDLGTFNATNFRNGDQYFVRIDKYFKSDRVYGSFFRTTLHFGGPALIPQFSTTNHNTQRALQVNWEHTFSPTTLNEATFAQNRIEGFLGESGDFTIPGISVNRSIGYGVGFAQGDFIQHNYHWRDVLTHVRGAHVFKLGYEGWFGDDVEPFQGPWSQPGFGFDNLLKLAQDAPTTEGGVMYNPITGQQQLWSWNAASKTWGIFAQDTWKARRNLTLTLGFRFDDQGNPYSKSPTTVFGNFLLGSGGTFQEQVANGVAKPSQNALNGSPKTYNPRIGAAWDVNGKGDWVLRGGFGMFSNWLTPANIQEEFRGNPPGLIIPSFRSTNPPGSQPIFVQGTSAKPPFGFTFPALAGTALCPTLPCLDSKGGIKGAQFTIGGINPNIVSPTAYIYSAALEHRLGSHFVASVIYSGSHSSNLVGGGNNINAVSYGSDINALPGDLIGKPKNAPPTRLNSSFGAINYTDNDRVSNYNGITADFRGRSKRAFFDVSYTRSSSKDDAGVYPTALNPHQFYGPSAWDVPNRISASFNYELPGLSNGQGAIGKLTGGWGLSGTSIFQTGNPFTVFTNASFANGGDYNADGDNLDYPDVNSYAQQTSRSAYLTGSFLRSQFTVPTLGTNGNEKTGQFRNPSFYQTNVTAYKNTHITERLNFQFRFEFYNVFNHVNFNGIQGNLNSGNFGVVTRQDTPRFMQIGGKITF